MNTKPTLIYTWDNYRVIKKSDIEDKYHWYYIEHKEHDNLEDVKWVEDIKITQSLSSGIKVYDCYTIPSEDFKKKVIKILGTLFKKLEEL
jgi:hypothetical protein